jgi:RNA polymerase sigma-70 factor (ECF subfamily)
MQEIMLALYQNIEKIEPIGRAKAYTFGIARNLCYEELRRRNRRRSIALADEAPDFDDYGSSGAVDYEYAVIASNEASPDEVTHWLMLNLEVQRAIDRLPEPHRQVLILYCEEEMSYAEIAEIMNTNIGTVKSRLFYAKRALRGLISPTTLRAIEDS